MRATAIACGCVLCGLVTIIAPHARAAQYPERPVRLIALNPPGGVSDTVARSVGEYLADKYGQPFVVDNRVGAGGIIGSHLVAQAPADGYTLLLGFVGNLSINPSLYKKIPYDPENDFAPVSLAARSPIVLTVHPNLSVNTVKDLVTRAKARPGQLRYASSGVGNGNHLAAELFATSTGIKLVHVPYKGGAPALTAVIQNEVDLLFGNSVLVLPQIKAGRVKPLAVTTQERLQPLPDVPTMMEAGVPDYVVTTWFGILAPAGTPTAIVQQLNAGIAEALNDQKLRQRFDAAGLIASPSTPQQFAEIIKSETNRWRKVIEATGASAQ